MKPLKSLLSLSALAIVLSSVACTRVGPGEVGIEVSMAGSGRGIQDIPIRTGWVFYNPLGTNIVEYPTYVQTAVWTKDRHEGSERNEEISFNSKDGLVFTADINVSFRLDGAKVPAFYLKYKSDDIRNFTHGMMRQVVRDEFNNVASTYLAEEIYGEKKEAYLKEIFARVNTHFTDVGLIIESVGFIGTPRPPEQFTKAVNDKLSANQKAQQSVNELKTAEADAKKRVAAAEGEAKANAVLAASLSANLLEWRRLDIQEKATNKWNGQVPQVQAGGGGTQGMFLNITPQ